MSVPRANEEIPKVSGNPAAGNNVAAAPRSKDRPFTCIRSNVLWMSLSRLLLQRSLDPNRSYAISGLFNDSDCLFRMTQLRDETFMNQKSGIFKESFPPRKMYALVGGEDKKVSSKEKCTFSKGVKIKGGKK